MPTSPPSNYAIYFRECFEMKWFDLFSLMRSSSIVSTAEGNRVLYFINEDRSYQIYKTFLCPSWWVCAEYFGNWSSCMLFISSPMCLLIPVNCLIMFPRPRCTQCWHVSLGGCGPAEKSQYLFFVFKPFVKAT